mgnify:CR=1 FL=1
MLINNEDIKIEGLDPFQDYDLSPAQDTPPGLIRVWFSVESIFMPFLSKEAGRKIDKNFLYLNWEKELGRSTGRRRLNDVVEFDTESNKWKIKGFSANGDSYIKAYPNEWNAFYNNSTADDAGTPIELLFKNDPARADMYKHFKVKTIERLAGISEGDATMIGMGALDDKKRASAFIAKTNAGVSSSQYNLEMQEIREENASLRSTVQDLTDKLTQMLQRELEAGSDDVAQVKRRNKQVKTETVEA